MVLDDSLFNELFVKAGQSDRLRANLDCRTTEKDNSQRMLNALQPGTKVPIHRHPKSSEIVICLVGSFDEVLFDDKGKEIARTHICPREGKYGYSVPLNVWHTVEVFEPTLIFEAKDYGYGLDGSENFIESK